MRGKKTAVLREHLEASGIPGLEGTTADNICQKVNSLEVVNYMIATRETLQVVTWLKRACEAIFVDPPAAVQPLAADAAGGPHA